MLFFIREYTRFEQRKAFEAEISRLASIIVEKNILHQQIEEKVKLDRASYERAIQHIKERYTASRADIENAVNTAQAMNLSTKEVLETISKMPIQDVQRYCRVKLNTIAENQLHLGEMESRQ